MKLNTGTVTAYLNELPAEKRRALETLREMIEKAAPQAKPTMKYGLPTWEWNGPLFALAARPRLLELYVAEGDVLARRKKAFGEVEVGTASVRFAKLEDLNLETVAAVLAEAADRRRRGPKAPPA